jgi:hypothetical protein
MWRHYVYIHRRLDTLKIFYVGKGSHKVGFKKQTFDRARDHTNRNLYWNRIVDKADYQIEILCSCQTDKEAQKIETELIAFIGRHNLCNMTDGGDGSAGLIKSEETRRKHSIDASKPRSEAWIKSIRVARKNGGNGGVVKKGDKLPAGWVANLAAAKMGNKNPYFGKPTAVAKLVLNLDSGIYYESVNAAALAHGINPKTLYQYLDGSRINKTNLKMVHND